MPINACSACGVRDVVICSALSTDELSELAATATIQTVTPRGSIVIEGDPAISLFNVTGGVVKTFKSLPNGRRQITGFLFEGDFLGIALNESYAFSAEAVDNVRLCRFPRTKFEVLLDRFPQLERRLLRSASNELVQAQDQMMLLGRKTAHEKVASFLLSLARRRAAVGTDSNPVFLPMGREDIADYLGLTTETVSRTFTKLKTERMIQLLPDHMVQLTDVGALSSIAEES